MLATDKLVAHSPALWYYGMHSRRGLLEKATNSRQDQCRDKMAHKPTLQVISL